MSTRTHPRPATHRPAPATRAQIRAAAARRRRGVGWAIAGAVAAAAVVLVVLGGRTTDPTAVGAAPPFALESTAGGEVALADHRGKNVLLYFNEGVGCDICFYQTAALEADPAFGDLDITFLPVVMNPAPAVREQLDRFGIATPYLVDPDGSVSGAYETLGTGHHADLPGHSLVLVGPDGQQRWRGDYPGMWVEPAELVAALSAEVAQ